MAKESGDLKLNNLADSYYSHILLMEPFLRNQKMMTLAAQE